MSIELRVTFGVGVQITLVSGNGYSLACTGKQVQFICVMVCKDSVSATFFESGATLIQNDYLLRIGLDLLSTDHVLNVTFASRTPPSTWCVHLLVCRYLSALLRLLLVAAVWTVLYAPLSV